ncbi:unnamed protein product [Sphagnum jensenii]|uniref:Uncharacterized protein n=2 Tax=Sphagnum jensenii TaxID=128206 RepID=A0ABP0ZZH7_9BRYO
MMALTFKQVVFLCHSFNCIMVVNFRILSCILCIVWVRWEVEVLRAMLEGEGFIILFNILKMFLCFFVILAFQCVVWE